MVGVEHRQVGQIVLIELGEGSLEFGMLICQTVNRSRNKSRILGYERRRIGNQLQRHFIGVKY